MSVAVHPAEQGFADAELAATIVPILIVNDKPAQTLALKAVLAPLGYLIVEADSGVAALRCVMSQNFAVILLDVRMPVMNGFETAALIRERRQSEMTPIIFITAHASDEIINPGNGYHQGAVDFIFAPVPPDELRAKVSVFANLFIKAEELAARARDVQASADQLRLLTEAAPIGIFQTDAENRYVYTNPRWSELTGINAEDAIGQEWGSMLSPTTTAGQLVGLSDTEVDRSEFSRRVSIEVPGSVPRIVVATSKAIHDGFGGVSGWVGTLADVTAEAGAEAALSDARDKANEASRLKSDFLANMSHEIRTPMNGVLGMTELLLETDLDDRQRDYAQTVRSSGESLLAIINDILDFSKVEAGMLELETIDVDLRGVVDDVANLLAGAAQAKGLEVITAVDRTVPAVISGDPGRVRQVLINLIGNAIKFTEAGEIAVRVTRLEDGEDARPPSTRPCARLDCGTMCKDVEIRFEVSDTGDGIAADQLAAVFGPFVQADTSTSRKYGGTGLGLAISAQLIALMGGDCGVSSTLGAGSDFWFTICVHADATQDADGPLAPDASLAGASVLVVDDNDTQRAVLADHLTNWGMTVETAGAADTALTAMRTASSLGRAFSVVLVDQSVKAADGLALTAAIDADSMLTTPLVLMSGVGHDPDPAGSVESGDRPLLTKPVQLEQLRSCMRIALGLQPPNGVPATASEPPSTQAHTPPAELPEMGRLLLAEDNLVNQKVAVAMLSGAGYRVDTVLNGAEAVKAVATQAYDAILMDCQMPELNGYEATAAIRADEGSDRRIPIIAMTAGARQEDRERCLAVGMDSYLAKPFGKDSLLELVASCVGTGRA